MEHKVYYNVVIPAAGQGKRMNAGKNKQFVEIGGKPIIIHTLEVFEQDHWCKQIVLIINEAERGIFEELISKYGIRKVKQIVPGGNERQLSVHNGLRVLIDDMIVLIHDGARPFVEQRLIHDLVIHASDTGAAILAVPVKDTIKRVENRLVNETIDRSALWIIQTPQAFRLSIVRQAHDEALKKGVIGTDDASLVELIGSPVSIVEGSYDNIKLTTKEDLIFGNAILEKRNKQKVVRND